MINLTTTEKVCYDAIKRAETNQKYYEKNKERIRATASQWYRDHREEQRAYMKGYRNGRLKESPSMTEKERQIWLAEMNDKGL